MKRTGKFLVALLAVIILLTSMSALTVSAATGQPEKLYLTPNSNWKQSNARFAAYFFGNGETWVSMTYNSTLGVYEVTVPTAKKYPNVIFCRMNPSASANNWNNKWNQTADLTIPTSGANHYTVKAGTWDKGGGTWSTLGSTCQHTNLSAAATCTEAQICLDCKDPIVSALGHTFNSSHLCTRCNTQATFTVAGSAALCGSDWSTTDTNNDMTFADGVYTKVYENVAAGTYMFKVARDHDWGTAYPDQDKSFKVDVEGSTVTITLKGTTVTVNVEAPVTECPHENRGPEATCTEPQVCLDCEVVVVGALGHSFNSNHLCTRCDTPAPFTVAGTGAHLGTEWDPANTANDMTYENGLWTKIYEDVNKGTYTFKVARDHAWDVAYPGQDKSFTVDADGSIVVITFNGSAVDVTVSVPHVCEYTEPATCLKGQHCKCGIVDPENPELGDHAYVKGICSVCGELDLEDTVVIYFENNWAWPTVHFFYWYGENGNNADWPGVDLKDPIAKTVEGHDVYMIEVPVGISGLIFSGAGQYGDEQCKDITEFSACDCFYMTWDEATQSKPAGVKEYHTWVGADCVTPGVCSVCQAEGEALGHDMVVDKAVDATCTATGLTEGSHCSRCDHKVEQEVVDALGHTKEVVTGKAATCTETGLTDGEKCSVCGETLVAQEEIPALNHKAADKWVKENEVLPTCEDKGSYDSVLRCSVCGEELDRETVETDALGHTAGKPVVENSTAPTCGAAGSYDEVVYCTVCGDELSRENHTVDTTPHSYREAITTAPTCTEAGVNTVTCSVCGDTYTEVIDALGHDKVSHEAQAPTCTNVGWDAYETCSRCDYTTYNELPKIKHSYEAVVTAPTCTDGGFTTNTCSACGASYISDEVAALGHDMVVDAAVAPTCTETGLTEGSHCTRCDHKVAQEVVDALGHDLVVDAAVAPTCEETGLTAGEHCTRCDHVVAQEVVDALGHDMVVDAAVAPTCTETGLTEGSHCTRCDHAVAQEVVSALGHDIVVDAAVAPTCTETGLTAGEHCTRCDYAVAQKVIPGLGHDMVVDAAVAPTCEETGLTEGSHCTRCDHKVAQQEVPATGHTFVEGKCHCGAEDPNYVAPNFFQRIWAAVVEFFKSIMGKITAILPKK